MSTRKSILVIDDDADIAYLVKASLQRHGYEAYEFNEPIKALHYFKENFSTFSSIISDVRMPGMGGLELASLVKKINPNVIVFLMTAFEIDRLRQEIDSTDMEIAEIFQKPISIKKMSEEVIKHIELNNSSKQKDNIV